MRYILSLRFIKLLAYKTGKWLQEHLQESHKRRYLYYFGLQVIYGAIFKGALLILLSILLSIFTETMLATLSFTLIRVYAGGVHFNSYTKCAYVSVSCLLFAGLIAKYFPNNKVINIIVFMLVFILLLLYSPVEHFNRPIKESEKVKFKILSLIILCLLFAVYILSLNQSIIAGVLLAGIVILPVNKCSTLRTNIKMFNKP